jgi:predicted O-linked N-acetylglucosamine transferase (SPINDLY family)
MGYSFLQSVGVNEGIARDWIEYVEWGVKLGIDINLRNAVIETLIQSKKPETLMPLWNPQKMASDIYSLFKALLFQNHQNTNRFKGISM